VKAADISAALRSLVKYWSRIFTAESLRARRRFCAPAILAGRVEAPLEAAPCSGVVRP
jgi:hypothetical protein